MQYISIDNFIHLHVFTINTKYLLSVHVYDKTIFCCKQISLSLKSKAFIWYSRMCICCLTFRALFTWESDIQVDQSVEQSMRVHLNEYKDICRMAPYCKTPLHWKILTGWENLLVLTGPVYTSLISVHIGRWRQRMGFTTDYTISTSKGLFFFWEDVVLIWMPLKFTSVNAMS